MTFEQEEAIVDQYCDGILRATKKKRNHKVWGKYRNDYFYEILSGWLHLCNDIVKDHRISGEPVPDIKFFDYARTILVAKIGKGRLTPTEVKATKEYKRAISKFFYHANKTKNLARNREYYAKHKQDIARSDHEYYIRNRNRILINKRIYREVHKSDISRRRKASYNPMARRQRGQRDKLRVLVNFTFGNI